MPLYSCFPKPFKYCISMISPGLIRTHSVSNKVIFYVKTCAFNEIIFDKMFEHGPSVMYRLCDYK